MRPNYQRRKRAKAKARHAPYRQTKPQASQWLGLPADKRELEKHDNFAKIRNFLHVVAKKHGILAGIPMPLEGERLVVEPTYAISAFALEFLQKMYGEEQQVFACDDDDINEQQHIRNEFYSTYLRSFITIFDNGDRIEWMVTPGVHHLDFDLSTLSCTEAWGIEQETNAMSLLNSLVRPHQFKQYLLAGMFMEKSERSGVHYLFRRLKPTVALSLRTKNQVRVMASLCGHPIGLYQGSWAGAMAPTDDVVASLMLMRGAEDLFWRRSEQHPPHHPAAGL